MSKATHPIDGEPTLREIIAELASGAFIESHDDGRNELRRPGRFVGQHTLVYHLLREGWLEQWANGGGYRLSEAGRLAYMGSTDELGDGELRAPTSGVMGMPSDGAGVRFCTCRSLSQDIGFHGINGFFRDGRFWSCDMADHWTPGEVTRWEYTDRTGGVAPAGAAAVLRDVVRCLRETGRYVDEEGEETDRLQELLDALPADGVLAQPTGKMTDASGVLASSNDQGEKA